MTAIQMEKALLAKGYFIEQSLLGNFRLVNINTGYARINEPENPDTYDDDLAVRYFYDMIIGRYEEAGK